MQNIAGVASTGGSAYGCDQSPASSRLPGTSVAPTLRRMTPIQVADGTFQSVGGSHSANIRRGMAGT